MDVIRVAFSSPERMDRPCSGNTSAPLNRPRREKELISRVKDELPVCGRRSLGIRVDLQSEGAISRYLKDKIKDEAVVIYSEG